MPHSYHPAATANASKRKSGSVLLKRDPTRTTMIREAFMRELRRRFKRLQREVWEFMVELDALGLADRKSFLKLNVQPREFEFRTSRDKLKAFQQWLQQRINVGILSVQDGTDPNEPWTGKYIESAYRKGMTNAYLATRTAADKEDERFIDKSQEAFLRDSFLQPETVSKVQLLATRSFEDLKGITASMGSQLNRILAQGMADGRGPRDMAREMIKSIAGMTERRAIVMARTEVIAAHATGQLDSFEELGVEELGLQSEFSTAGDERVCSVCDSLSGKVYSVEDARGVIPVHPQCRCSWLPWIESEHGKAAKEE